MINEQFAEKLFASQGFCLACVDRSSGDILFSRSCSDHPGLFEYVQIQLAGKKLDTASADVGVNCVRVRGPFSWRGLAERFCVLDVATNKERGQSTFTTFRDSELWLERLVEVLPRQISYIRETKVPVLEQRTLDARTACKRYLDAIGYPCSAKTANAKLLAKASEEQSVEANLILSHEVGWIDDPTYHFAAVLAVCSLSREVEPNVRFNLLNPREDTPLMWRVNIIADHLMAYPRQMTLVFPRGIGSGHILRKPMV